MNVEERVKEWLAGKGDLQIIVALVALCVICAMLSATVLHSGKFEGITFALSVFFGAAAVICTAVVCVEEYFENNRQR
ncbi:MAG TPA: hypothetical protein VMV71_00410 [Candidatus Paceibacterota bacterium]|nr:hypothetical protein [Candidatus Paceibacterota bacterium]